MQVEFKVPNNGHLFDIAPRWQGRGDYIGEYGYALAITDSGKIRCLMDDGGVDDIAPKDLIFITSDQL